VLWFLRQHAPMPPPFEVQDMVSDDEVEHEPSKTNRAMFKDPHQESDATDRRGSVTRVRLHQQAEFLHRTLMAIGHELQESGGSPVGGAGAKPKSARHREELRRCYAEHTDAECVQLRRRVAAREAEVTLLRQQVEQSERVVQATRLAATRRSIRLRASEGNAITRECSIGATMGVLRAKKTLTSMSGNAVFDAETSSGRTSPTPGNKEEREMTFEDDLQAKLAQQWEIEQTTRGTLEENKRLFEQQTIQRKANEAGLFGTHAEILKIRAKALKTEARVTRLANDLRRVYKQLPEVVRQKIQQSTPEREFQKELELRSVKTKHQLQHLKWLTSEELDDHIGVSDAAIEEMTSNAAQVEKILARGKQSVASTLEKVEVVREGLTALHDAWGRLSAKAPVAMTGCLVTGKDGRMHQKPGSFGAQAEQVQGIIQEALLLTRFMLDAANLLECKSSDGQQRKWHLGEEDSERGTSKELSDSSLEDG